MSLPHPELDLTRLAYVAAARADEFGLSYTELQRCTGCSKRQISYLMNAKPINSGATFMLAEVLGIDLAGMFKSVTTSEHIARVRRMCADHQEAEKVALKQAVTPPVSRETEAAE